MAPSRPQPGWSASALSEKAAVAIMPAPTEKQISPPQAPAKKKRRVEKKPSPISSPSASPCSEDPPVRRRAPALERLPKWLSIPRRHFIAAGACFPLPARVAVRGNPFYDWDAWALALLEPNLWRRRGPWQRLIACCTAAKPPSVHVKNVPDVKAALVRIVVAEVVSMLVSRKGNALTPEDRNWITSVASRQRGRHARKPTLMLLFDLAFALFDLANFCARTGKPSPSKSEPECVVEYRDGRVISDERDGTRNPIETAVKRLVAEALRCETLEEAASPLSTGSRGKFSPQQPNSTNIASVSRRAMSVEDVVLRVLDIVHERRDGPAETWMIDNVNQVITVIEKVLSETAAPRWHQRYTTHTDAATEGVTLATKIFTRRLPLANLKKVADENNTEPLKEWLQESLGRSNWGVWADLANDCNYLMIAGGLPEVRVQELACRQIVASLLDGPESRMNDRRLNNILKEQEAYHPMRLTLRTVLDVALALEKFYSFFLETYGIDTVAATSVKWGVLCFEGLVQLLSKLRELLIKVTNWEEAMIHWSTMSLDISNYYREVLLSNPYPTKRRCEDIERAIQSAFAEASWAPKTRAERFMIRAAPERTSEGSEVGNADVSQFWLTSFNLNDPVYWAAAIAPWDPCRALQLLDLAIGLTPYQMNRVCQGLEHLPLWDYRRISVCRLLLVRNSFVETKLVMERLQVLFDQIKLHVGGNFSNQTMAILEKEVTCGNFCAQTTLGLLYAGQGQYWDVARSWAHCGKNIQYGIERLFLSVMAGDLEACTAFSHILTLFGDESKEICRLIEAEQVYTLMRISHMTQNANAMMNMGVIFRYGFPGIARNDLIAIDLFLVAIQGGLSAETRAVAAHHLAQTVGEEQRSILEALSKLTSTVRPSTSLASSPLRIDDFCGSSL